MNEFDHGILALLEQQRERPENPGLNWDSNPDLCDTGAKLYPLSYQANWEQVAMWVAYKVWPFSLLLK